jgi:hypothetical protein
MDQAKLKDVLTVMNKLKPDIDSIGIRWVSTTRSRHCYLPARARIFGQGIQLKVLEGIETMSSTQR